MVSVRIATFNVWSAALQRRERRDAAAHVLGELVPDLLAVQELRGPDDELVDALEGAGYRLILDEPDPDADGDCPAIFSRHEVIPRPTPHPLVAVSATTVIDGLVLGFTSVHLPSIAVAVAERMSVALADWLDEQRGQEIMAGDFNSSPQSSVGRFWAGEQSLAGREQRWLDPVERWCWEQGVPAPSTLDFVRNPRWQHESTLETPARFDRVLVRDTWKQQLPSPSVRSANLFGTEPAGPARIVPSDHYGVVADLTFEL